MCLLVPTFLKYLDSTVSAHANYSMAKVWLGLDNIRLGKEQFIGQHLCHHDRTRKCYTPAPLEPRTVIWGEKKWGRNPYCTPPSGSIQLGNRFEGLGKLKQHMSTDNQEPSASPVQPASRTGGAPQPAALVLRELQPHSFSKATSSKPTGEHPHQLTSGMSEQVLQ